MNRALEKLKNQDGVSMIVAMVFYLVITLACITLFHVTSGSIRQSANYRDNQLADIMATSMSQVVQQQIQNGVIDKTDVNYDGRVAVADGSDLIDPANDLADYILSNLNRSWLYYNEDQILYANKEAATRVLKLEGLEDENASGQISMYWTSDLETEMSGVYTNRKLYVVVTINVGLTSSSVTSEFEMSGRPFMYADRSDKLPDQYYWWRFNEEMK